MMMTQILALMAAFGIFTSQMNLDPTIEAIVKRQAVAWETANVSKIVRDFAPDATFIAGGFTFQGVAAIQKAAEDYFRQFSDTKVTIKRIITGADNIQGAAEWDWSDRNKQNGQPSQAEDAIIFELQDDGKISYWREYIEKID